MTVTLKRARRVRPQRTKKERKAVSAAVRRPREKATAAGATPNEIWVVSFFHKISEYTTRWRLGSVGTVTASLHH